MGFLGTLGLARNRLYRELAGGLGFEPRLAESESAVLPLDDPPPGCPHRAVGQYKRGDLTPPYCLW